MSLVILDRDGVINFDSDDYIKSADEWQPIPGSLEAISELSQAGFTVAVATNQSGLGRGLFDLDELEAMHQKLVDGVADLGGQVAGIFYCPHLPDAGCDCRKPKPGLLDAIERELEVTVAGAPYIGDSLKDIEAALARQCQPILVTTGKGEATLAKLDTELREKISVFENLAAAAANIINPPGERV